MSLRAKWLWLGALLLLGLWVSVANFVPEETRKASALWPDEVMRLGLDLQGGVHIVIGPDLDAAIQQELGNTQKELKRRLDEDGVSGVAFDQEARPETLLVKPPSASALAAVEKILEEYETLAIERSGDYDLALSFTDTWYTEVRERAMKQAIEVLRRRVDDPDTGILESVVTRKGSDKILVEIPGMSRVPDIFRQTGHLEFKIVQDAALTEELLRAKYPDGLPAETMISTEVEKSSGKVVGAYLVPTQADMQGAQLENAFVSFGQTRAEWVVNFVWSAEGGQAFAELTERNVNQPLAIVIDGTVVSAPNIQTRIARQGQITGNFSADTASDLAIILRSGALPIPTRIEEERTVGPALGADSIRKGGLASAIALAAVVVFMVVYYRRSGVYAAIALAFNVVLLLALLSIAEATLTMPGIAGLVLTMGMAVDANVIIFERIREELRSGRTPRAAIAAGFERAFATILDSNVTTFIAGVVLFFVGTGPIVGFAVTLMVGIVTSVFTALVVTRALYDWKPGTQPVSELSI